MAECKVKVKNKKILLIAPKFYDYHNEIIKELTFLGGKVIFFNEMNQSILYRVSKKIDKRISYYLERKHINFILSSVEKNSFDIVFLIRGEYFLNNDMCQLKTKLPRAMFVMYQWDSVEQNDYTHLIKYFDIVKTFDMKDAQKYSIIYQPLFYTNHYKATCKPSENSKYDLVFYGAYHSDRLEIIKEISEISKRLGLVFRSHLYITKLALLKSLVTGSLKFQDIKYFKTYSLPVEEIVNSYKNTKAVLDVELSIQNGLTIRTFEVLGAGIKLVTTNENIKQENFYDENVIMVIDRKKIEIFLDFFNASAPLDEKYKEFYIVNWLEKIMTVTRD